MSRKVCHVGKECVACGSCIKVCPRGALSVPKGVCAVVEASSCIGCGKCTEACPAGILELNVREADAA